MRKLLAAVVGALVFGGMSGCSSTGGSNPPPKNSQNPPGSTDPGNNPPPSDPGPKDPTLPIETVQGAVPPSSPAIRYSGRFDNSDPNGPIFAWSASSIAIKFTGTSATVHLHQGSDAWRDSSGTKMQNEYDVFVDGNLLATTLITTPDVDDYPLVSGLSNAVHTLRLVKRTEAVAGRAQFLGFTFDARATVGAPDAPAHRLEFIGDSITAGYGVEGIDEHCRFTAATEDADHSYAGDTTLALGTETVVEAFQGKGMFRNFDPADTDTMPNIYARIFPTEVTPTWSPTGFAPEAIVVNLGTNDFANGDPGQGYVTAYEDFLGSLRAQNPNALLVIAMGPMLDDYSPAGAHQLTTQRGYLQQVLAARQAAGDANVGMIEFPAQDGSLGYGCEWHPSRATQQQMADQLTQFLKAKLGW